MARERTMLLRGAADDERRKVTGLWHNGWSLVSGDLALKRIEMEQSRKVEDLRE